MTLSTLRVEVYAQSVLMPTKTAKNINSVAPRLSKVLGILKLNNII
jgi:hypothetical protein